ncbi:MAG: HD domain-containing protein [Thermogutta sp.]
MYAILDIPELRACDEQRQLVRIPPELDVPLTDRIKRLIDTVEFRRLARITQLGLVALVYPAANHTRFEHSLGVYRLALLFLKRLESDERFRRIVRPEEAELLIVAALLHDLGHWPFCHAIEDLQLPGVPRHEMFVSSFLLESEIGDILRNEWNINPRDVVHLLHGGSSQEPGERLLAGILSGPIDIDKMDYLYRDSVHAGVPYGRNFDQQRLVKSLCVNEAGDGLAITEKGKTAAELMLFARYVMFSEVYWHHAVRSATAMLQRAFYQLYSRLDLDVLFRQSEWDFVRTLRDIAGKGAAGVLLEGVFGTQRCLFKRVAQFSAIENEDLYRRLARRPYPWLAACGEELAALLSARIKKVVAPFEVLVDAPPVHKEIEFQVDVFFPKEQRYRPLGQVSPVVRALAQQQFDDYVKRVRIFAAPRISEELRDLRDFDDLVHAAVDRADS